MKLTSHYTTKCFSGSVPLASVLGELQELKQARTLPAIWDEWNDLCAMSLAHTFTTYGINLPVLPGLGRRSMLKYERRIVAWKLIFKAANLPFYPFYLKGGSNYHNPDKVSQALSLARSSYSLTQRSRHAS